MPWPVHPVGFFGSGDQDTYKVERSLRFNSADSAYLNRTPASAGNRKTWTWSGWVKRSVIGSGSNYALIGAGGTAPNYGSIRFSSDSLQWFTAAGGSGNVVTTQIFRDVSSWYHIVVVLDTTQATASSRVKMYVNGSEITSFSTSTYPTQNYDGEINNNVIHAIGSTYTGTYQELFNGYLTEINFIDGQALTPSSFGETDPITGRWKAKRYAGTYGTNGFYLNFADNSGTTSTTLGKDLSGNGNNWTPNNFSVTAGAGNDSLLDSPTDSGASGNYATLNPLKANSAFTLSNGNLDFSATSSASNSLYVTSSVGISSGKWYWEVTPSNIGAGPNIFVGIRLSSASTTSGSSGIFDSGYGYGAGGNKRDGTGDASYGASYANNDVVGIALDLDAGTLVFYKNGVSQGTAFSGLSGTFEPAINLNVSGVSRTIAGVCNFGQRPFAYTAPTGFKALCTTNLPTPTIKKPGRYMDVRAYTGTGASNSITGLDFSPDLVWIKNRGGATDHALYDTTRGTQAQLSSNTTGSEVTSSTGLTAFGTNGFTIGTSSLVNTSGTQYVAWTWDAGEASSTNTAGSITSTVRVNPLAGVSIVSYAGTGSNTTVGHGLGSAPKFIFGRRRNSTGSWQVFHLSIPNMKDGYITLNATTGYTSLNTIWNATNPTSTVFSLGTDADLNQNGTNMIAYCFAEVEGFSKFGSYTGNGSSDGPFVWCGFRPRWVMIKRTDAANDWVIMDSSRNTYNYSDSILWSDLSNAETSGGTTTSIDIISNGFKAKGAGASINTSGGTYVFAAFAESAYKYSRAR